MEIDLRIKLGSPDTRQGTRCLPYPSINTYSLILSIWNRFHIKQQQGIDRHTVKRWGSSHERSTNKITNLYVLFLKEFWTKPSPEYSAWDFYSLGFLSSSAPKYDPSYPDCDSYLCIWNVAAFHYVPKKLNRKWGCKFDADSSWMLFSNRSKCNHCKRLRILITIRVDIRMCPVPYLKTLARDDRS